MKDLLELVEQALISKGMTARQASIKASGKPDLIATLRRGRAPSVERIRSLCEVLDLEFHIGPRRREADPDALRKRLAEAGAELDQMLAKTRRGSRTESIPFVLDIRFDSDGLLVRESTRVGIAAAPEALPTWARVDKLCCIRMTGRSMEPTLQDGDLVVVDCSHVKPLDGELFAVAAGECLLVRRFRLNGEEWEIFGDNPERSARRPARGSWILGRVVWQARPYSTIEEDGNNARGTDPDHAPNVGNDSGTTVMRPTLSRWTRATKAQRDQALRRLEAVERSDGLVAQDWSRAAADEDAALEARASAKAVARWRRRVQDSPPDERLEVLLDAPGRGRPSQWTRPGGEELWEEWCQHMYHGPAVASEAWAKTEPFARRYGWKMPKVGAFKRRAKAEGFAPVTNVTLAMQLRAARQTGAVVIDPKRPNALTESVAENPDEPSIGRSAEGPD